MPYTEHSLGLAVELPHWAQENYRWRVPALIATTYALVAVVFLFGLPEWLVLFGLISYLIAALATYNRLREKGRSGWWILLMLAHISLGPKWMGISLAGTLINLVPIMLAWRPADHSANG